MKPKEILLDASEMEAPLPLIEAVKLLDSLQKDEVLLFKHRMNPKHLFHEIEMRGMEYEIIEDAPNNFVMKIFHKGTL